MYTPPPPPYGYGSPTQPMGDMRARLRPMGIGDILDMTFRLYRENFVLFLGISALAIVLIVVGLIILVGAAALTSIGAVITAPTSAPLPDNQLGQVAALGLAGLVFGVIALVLYLAMTAALIIAIARRYLDHPITLGQAYRTGLRYVWRLFLAGLWIITRFALIAAAIGVVVALLTKLNLTPLGIILAVASVGLFIYLAFTWYLTPQTLVLENTGAFSASKRSRQLIKGYWWKTFGLLIVLAILTNIIANIPAAIVGGVITTLTNSQLAGEVANFIANLLVDIVTTPISFIATTLLFYDLKIRKEAFDLEAIAQRQQSSVPYGQPAPPRFPQY